MGQKLHHTSFLLTLILCFLASTGCGMMSNPYGPDKLGAFDPNEGKGLFILSTGAPERCFAVSTFLRLFKEGSIGYYKDAYLGIDAYFVKSDFPTHQGSLHVLKVDAGNYYFLPHVANPHLSFSNPFMLRFSVGAGEMVYLGEYFMPFACSIETHAQINDQMERDLRLIQEQTSAIDTTRVVKRLLTFSPR